MIKLERIEGFDKVSEEHRKIIEPLFNQSFSAPDKLEERVSEVSKKLGKEGDYGSCCVFIPKKEFSIYDILSSNGVFPLMYKHGNAGKGFVHIGNVIYFKNDS